MARRFTTAVGVVALALGVLAVVAPGVAAALPLDSALVPAIGVLAVVVGVYAIQRWRNAERSAAELPTPETTADYRTPGDEFDDHLAAVDEDYLGAYNERQAIRERLTQLAVTVLADHPDWSEPAAREALERGTWTDDPHAAAYFAGGYPEWAPLRYRLRDRSPIGSVPFSLKIERAVAEIEALSLGDGTPPSPPEGAVRLGDRDDASGVESAVTGTRAAGTAGEGSQ